MDIEKTLNRYKEIIDSGLKTLFDEKILDSKDFIRSGYSYLKEFVLRGGKRLRPAMTMMAFKAVCDQDENRILLPAVGIELFHNSSLIHDDIMDEESERRGMLSMHKKFEELFLKSYGEKTYEGQLFRKMSGRFGVSLAILQGDILYALTENCFTHSPFDTDKIRRALDVVNDTYRVICEGQMLDVLSELKRDITEEDYLGVIESKTSHLFRAAVQVGAIFGGAAAPPLNALSRYAFSVGTAFQLLDDLMDISPGLKGRAFGSDIRRGKYTLLMIRAFEAAGKEHRQRLLSALGNDKADRRTMKAAVEALYATGAVDHVKRLACQKLREGQACLKNAGLSEEASAFFEGLADFMVL
jgi:geranylgeranyl pyrophosphate synthase